MTHPKVSVLLPIYGQEPHLCEALSSLSSQTFADFEVLAVTEDLSPRTAEILDDGDVSITEIQYNGDGGLAGALNLGIKHANGDYLARFDADDVALPRRLERQVDAMDSNPEVGVMGGGYVTIDADGNCFRVISPVTSHTEICWKLLLANRIGHPTAIIRHSVVDKTGIRYRPKFNAAEDYDLWVRLAEQTTLRNLAEPLIKYRIQGNRVSDRDNKRQIGRADTISTRTIGRWLPESTFSRNEVHDMKNLLHRKGSEEINKSETVANVLRLYRSFENRFLVGQADYSLRSEVAVTTARGILRPPLQAKSLLHLGRLLILCPYFPLSIVYLIAKRLIWIGNIKYLMYFMGGKNIYPYEEYFS